MNWIKQYVLRRRHCRDLSEEIREHLAQKAEELVAAGCPERRPLPQRGASLEM